MWDVMRRIMKTTSGIFHYWLFDCKKLLPHSARKELIQLLSSRGKSTAEKEDYTWSYLENTFLGKKNQSLGIKTS